MATMQSSGFSKPDIKVGVLTVSDSCHTGTAKDSSGPNLCHLTQTLINNGIVAEQAVVPDEADAIKEKLLEWCDQKQLNVVFTTGGTGFAPRDITPEVTKSVIEKEAPGLTIAMIKASLDVTPMAMLSRLTCGIRGSSIIINLPGSKKGSEECFKFVLPGLSHAVALVRGDGKEVSTTHKQVQAQPDLSKTIQTSAMPGTKRDKTVESWIVTMPVHRNNRGKRKARVEENIDEGSTNSTNKRQQTTIAAECLTACSAQGDNVIDNTGRKSPRQMPRTRAQRKLYASSHPAGGAPVATSAADDSDVHHEQSETEAAIEVNADKSHVTSDLLSISSSEASVIPNILSHHQGQSQEVAEFVARRDNDNVCRIVPEFDDDTEDTQIYVDNDIEEYVDETEELENVSTNEAELKACRFNSREVTLSGEGMVIDDNAGDDLSDEVNKVQQNVESGSSSENIFTFENENRLDGIREGNESECAQILYELSKSSQSVPPQQNSNTGADGSNLDSVSELKFGTCDANRYDNNMEVADKPDTGNKSNKSKRTFRILSTKPKRHSKDAEVNFAQVGKSAKIWCQNHPLINGIYLNKGKREVKRNLVVLRRQPTAIDKGSYLRNGWINDKNRIDDYFEFTEEGKKRREQFEEGLARDEYVVNWYMWCPGHGNCLRKCGGYGKCKPDCPGSKHKQDRHNCSLMLTWKLYLSDLDKWRIQITGSHVPIESNVRWTLPAGKERLDEDTRDIILEYSNRHCLQSLTIKKLIEQKKKSVGGVVPSCNRISRFVENKRKKQSLKDQDVRTTLQRQHVDGAVVGESFDKSEDMNGTLADQVSIIGSSAGHVIDGSQCTSQDAVSGNTSGYIVTYYDGTPVSAVFGSASDFLQNNMTLSNEQNVAPMYNIQKHDSQVPDTIVDQSGMGHMTNHGSSHVTTASSTIGSCMGGDDIGAMSMQGSHVTQDVVGPQHVHLVPQHVQSPLQSSAGRGVPVVGLDVEGLPCYGNFGDLSSFFVTCQQSQTQT